MKKILIAVIILVSFSATAQNIRASAHYRHAQKMIKDKDYFHAEDYIYQNDTHFSHFETLVLQANMDNIFNSPALSNKKIEILFQKYPAHTGDSLTLALLRLKHANHARLFEYKEAKQTAQQILGSRSVFLDAAERADFENMGNIWALLEGQPKQEVIVVQAASVKMTRDKANLANLPVTSRNVTSDFIFDTGANLSTVTESTAAKMGMTVFGGSIEVGSITGTKVEAQMAICPEFSMGSITVKNAVFLVFPDASLAFPQINYQINGIIGFPVIEALKEIQITKDDRFIVPHRQTPISGLEMALDFLTPVIRIGDEHYTFDTGAVGTSLYAKYFEKHKVEVISNYKETGLQFGGAGGMTTKKGYNVTFMPVIDGKQLKIENVQLFTGQTGDDELHFYGNIGQDLIKQFGKMTISFQGMFIRLD